MNRQDREALDAHITGQYEDRTGPDEPFWAIDDDEGGGSEIIASLLSENPPRYHVRECQPPHREVVISFQESQQSENQRMLFDGVDIETESFMAYVGLLDMVDESPGKVIHIKNGDFIEDKS